MLDDRDVLARTAACQRGLLTVAQLQAAGLTNVGITKLKRKGALLPVRRGLYSTTPLEGSFEQLVMAACLHPHVVACATGLTAARLWGLWTETEHVDVAVRYPTKISAQGATVHRSRDLLSKDITRLDCIPVTTPARTLCDLGRVLPEPEVVRLLDHAVSTHLVTAGRVLQLRIRIGAQGRNGAGVIGRALATLPEAADETESGPEVDTLRALEEGGLPTPERQLWITAAGRRYRLDLAYPAEKVAIEYDGHAWHHTPEQLAADSRRQEAAESIGWLILRTRKEDLRSPGRSAFRRRVAATLRSRQPSLAWDL